MKQLHRQGQCTSSKDVHPSQQDGDWERHVISPIHLVTYATNASSSVQLHYEKAFPTLLKVH